MDFSFIVAKPHNYGYDIIYYKFYSFGFNRNQKNTFRYYPLAQ